MVRPLAGGLWFDSLRGEAGLDSVRCDACCFGWDGDLTMYNRNMCIFTWLKPSSSFGWPKPA